MWKFLIVGPDSHPLRQLRWNFAQPSRPTCPSAMPSFTWIGAMSHPCRAENLIFSLWVNLILAACTSRNPAGNYQLLRLVWIVSVLQIDWLGLALFVVEVHALPGAPIKNNPLEKILYLRNCSRFFHQIYAIYRGGFRPCIQQIAFKYLVWFQNYNYLNLKVHFSK